MKPGRVGVRREEFHDGERIELFARAALEPAVAAGPRVRPVG